MVALEDEANQTGGFVCVMQTVGVEKHDSKYADLMANAHMLKDGIPFRLAALHYCFDNTFLRSAMSLLQMMVGRDNRLRFRAHYGKFFPSSIIFCH